MLSNLTYRVKNLPYKNLPYKKLTVKKTYNVK